jgi:gamma-glutamyltranspeptidase/glutathione hydrolase
MRQTTRPTLQGTFGMASASHWLVSGTAMGILERGGNAFDAAVAAAFVEHVVEPNENSPAGDANIIFATAADNTPRVLVGQGPAPAGATIEHYTGLGLEVVPGNGTLAAAIPGAIDAWLLLLRDYGTMRLREVMDAAIGYAEHGHPIIADISAKVTEMEEMFRTEWTSSADLYLTRGRPPRPGEMHRNPALAATWQRLLTEAESAGADREAQIEKARLVWSEGFIAEEIVAFAKHEVMDASGTRHAGVLTAADLAGHRAHYEEPLTFTYGEWTVAKSGPWGQAPVFLQQLALLPDPSELTYGSADLIHRVAEGVKLAFADREAWYGDGFDTPMADLLSKDYNDARRALIGEQASRDLRPGSPGGRPPVLPERLRSQVKEDGQAPGIGEPTTRYLKAKADGDTCHFDIVDRWGNMISGTPSGGWLHSNPVIPALGFPLGTRLQMTWLEPGYPTSLTPGRRPRTTLSPCLALRDGVPAMAFGTPGGDAQDQWAYNFFLGVAVGGLTLQEAADAPGWHTMSFPNSFYPRASQPASLYLEDRHDPEVVAGLRRRGHDVKLVEPWSLGRLAAVARDPETGVVSAAASPREMRPYAVGR